MLYLSAKERPKVYAGVRDGDGAVARDSHIGMVAFD